MIAGFGEYYVSLVFISSSVLWAIATVSVMFSNTATRKYVEFTETPLKFGSRSNNLEFYYILTKYNKPENAPDDTPDAALFVTKYTRVSN